MKYDPDVHHRRSIRLNGYDYSQDGAHFITVCAQNRECLFGEMVNGQMAMNDAGRMVQTVWDEIPENYHGIETDEFALCVQNNDAARLTKLPGVGKKTAERLIVEMRDRLDGLPTSSISTGKNIPNINNDPVNEAVSALIGLGYKPPEASRFVLAIAADGMTSEELIREALKNSVKK